MATQTSVASASLRGPYNPLINPVHSKPAFVEE